MMHVEEDYTATMRGPKSATSQKRHLESLWPVWWRVWLWACEGQRRKM